LAKTGGEKSARASAIASILAQMENLRQHTQYLHIRKSCAGGGAMAELHWSYTKVT